MGRRCERSSAGRPPAWPIWTAPCGIKSIEIPRIVEHVELDLDFGVRVSWAVGTLWWRRRLGESFFLNQLLPLFFALSDRDSQKEK